MKLFYYLPEIICVAALAAVLVFGLFFVRDLFRKKKGESSCIYCKAAAAKISRYPYLFLIPVSFGEIYEEPEKYLLSHMRPIAGKEQIPTGMRACYVEVYSCTGCDKKHVVVKDFLQVRGEDHIKEIHEFAYEPFRPLLEAWEETNQVQEKRNQAP